jgi:hypothetical protein
MHRISTRSSSRRNSRIARAETAQQRHLDNKTNLALSILGVVPPLRAASTLNTIESNVAPTMLDRAKALVGFVSGPGAEAASVVKGLDTAEKNVMQSMIRKHGLSTKDVIGIQNYMKKNPTFVDELATKTRNAQNAVLAGAIAGYASGKAAGKLAPGTEPIFIPIGEKIGRKLISNE